MGDTVGSSPAKQCVPETWWTSFMEGDTAAHSFQVTGFSLLDGMGGGNLVSSSTFRVGDCESDITFYPDGWKVDGGAHASAFLRLCKGEPGLPKMLHLRHSSRDWLHGLPGLQTSYTLSLLGKDGQVFEQVSLEHVFKSTGTFWGYERFVKKSKLQRLVSRNDDCVTIRCVLTVKRKHRTEEVRTLTILTPPSNLHEDIARMLKDEDGVDVAFVVGEKLFRAHQHILAARSPAFKAELLDPMTKEDPTNPVNVHDMTSDIFEALLHFMYTDTLPHGSDLEKTGILWRLLAVGD
ncbi:BTB/POZ and MATH domain-containing protein 3-like [Triticum aestivum]|uniref:BTB/POZ and MATH domain-containing protein 3-like n=1 Tax=Triticum aestivum TaxID=4565 RepID=UPI001D022F9D|nr:BTB/POZ and MATH domain-containing protein 3-like [Triticum aestivum]